MLFRHEPATLPQASAVAPGGFISERPPAGLARGQYPAPPWAIAAFGAALVLVAILYFVLRLRKPHS